MSRHTGPLLTVDIGNTNVHWRLFGADGAPGEGGCHPTARAEVAAELVACAAHDAGGVPVVICSVVPEAEAQIRAALTRAGRPAAALGRELPVPLRTRYEDPTEIGPDRLANAAGALAAVGGACLVAAVGTALTVDAVSADGTHLGGVIAPGPEAALSGLLSRVAAPSLRRLAPPEASAELLRTTPPLVVPGTSTAECLRAGLLLGFAGLLDRLVEVQQSAVGGAAPVLGTGGALPALLPHCRTSLRVEPELGLRGLRAIWLTVGGAT